MCKDVQVVQEMAGRWCHHFVCLVLTIELYVAGYTLTTSVNKGRMAGPMSGLLI